VRRLKLKTPTVFRIPAQGYGSARQSVLATAAGLRGVTLGWSPGPIINPEWVVPDLNSCQLVKFVSMKALAPITSICFVKSMRTQTLATVCQPNASSLFALITAHLISGQICPKTC
jgi:hypothetical protein